MRISDWSSDVCSSDLFCLSRIFDIEMDRMRVHRQQREPAIVCLGNCSRRVMGKKIADGKIFIIAPTIRYRTMHDGDVTHSSSPFMAGVSDATSSSMR